MTLRELPEGFDEQRLTEEFQERLRAVVSEPGYKTLAYDFGGRPGNDPLTPMELKTLESCSKPLSPDWESKPTFWERGDECMSAYGTLTYRGLIYWEINNGWLVPFTTELGNDTLKRS